MSLHTRVSHLKGSPPSMDVEGFELLAELALDLRWSWNHATDDLWRRLDPMLWTLTQNPWVVLQTASRERVERLLADPAFRKQVDDAACKPSGRRQAPGVVSATISPASI